MKKFFLFIVMVIEAHLAYSQEKYVYNEYGKLNYIISDSLSVNKDISGVCLLIEHRDTAYFLFDGRRCGYSESTTYIVNNGKFTFHEKVYTPILFGKETDLSSMYSFLAYLSYVEEKHPDSNIKVKFDYADPRTGLTARVVFDPSPWKWKFVLDKNIYKIEAISNIKKELEELIKAYTELL